MQKIRMALAAAAIGFTTMVSGLAPVEAAGLSAAPLASVSQIGGGLVQTVDWRDGFCWRHPGNWRCRHYHHYRHYRHYGQYGYCARSRSACAERWGWHTYRYRVCLRRHNCY